MPDYLDKFTEKKKDGTPIQSVPIRDSDAQERLATVEGKLTTSTTSASGNPLSITGLKSTQNAINPVITLEPIQDLHGQDKPYPAGGGKNKFPLVLDDLKTMNTSGTWNGSNYTYDGITFSVLTDSDGNVTGIKVTGTANTSNSYVPFVFTEGYHTLDYYGLNVGETYTLSGCQRGGTTSTYSLVLSGGNTSNIYEVGTGLSFTVDSTSTYSYQIRITKDYTVPSGGIIFYPQIEQGSTATTFAPYSNECPISGYDKIEVLSCGKNLIDISKLGSYQVTASGTMRYGVPVYLKAGTYTLSKSSGSAVLYITNVTNDYSQTEIGSSQYPYTFTISTNSYVIIRTVTDQSTNWDIVNLQVEEGSAATTYSPYHKTTDLSENLPQTVYGGTLDLEKGKLLVNSAYAILDGSNDENWYIILSGTQNWFYYIETGINSIKDEIISNLYPQADIGLSTTDKGINVLALTGVIRIREDNEDTVENFKARLAQNPLQIVVKLRSAITIQLTPHEISLLKDYAYVLTNGTRIDLDYRNGEMATLEDVLDAQNKLQEEIDNPISYDGKNYRLGMDATGLYLYNITDDTKAYIQMVTP